MERIAAWTLLAVLLSGSIAATTPLPDYEAHEASVQGQFVAFSTRDRLDDLDTNGLRDVYRVHLGTGVADLISQHNGQVALDESHAPSMNCGATRIAFASKAALVPTDTNNDWDVYLWDNSALSRISHGPEASWAPSIDCAGEQVVYASRQSHVEDNGQSDIYLYDVASQTTRVLTPNTLDHSFVPVISADGSTVAFHSRSRELDATDQNTYHDVYAVDLDTGDFDWLSRSPTGSPTNGDSTGASISSDGRFVAFTSQASNLRANDIEGYQDIYVYDRNARELHWITQDLEGNPFQGHSRAAHIQGERVMFETQAATDERDTDTAWDVYVKELTGALQMASVYQDGTNYPTPAHAISIDYPWAYYQTRDALLTHGVDTVVKRDLRLTTLPQSDFSWAPQYPGIGETVTFTATPFSPEASIIEYEWDVGGQNATTEQTSRSWLVPGPKQVALTITDSRGYNHTHEQTVEVGMRPPVANFWNDLPRSYEPITLHDDSHDPDDDIASWTWRVNGVPTTRLTNASHTVNLAQGNHSVQLTVTDGFAQSNTKTVAQFQVYGYDPVADFSVTPSPGSVNDTFTVNDASSDAEGPVVIQSIDWGDGTNGTNTSHQYAYAGTYTVTLTIRDMEGLHATASRQVLVTGKYPTADFVLLPTQPANGTVVELRDLSTDEDGSITETHWIVNGQTYQSTKLRLRVWEGPLSITQIVVDDSGLQASKHVDLVINDAAPVPRAAWTPHDPFAGEQVTFTSQSWDQEGNASVVQWQIDDVVTSISSPVAVMGEGQHRVLLTVQDEAGQTAQREWLIPISAPTASCGESAKPTPMPSMVWLVFLLRKRWWWLAVPGAMAGIEMDPLEPTSEDTVMLWVPGWSDAVWEVDGAAYQLESLEVELPAGDHLVQATRGDATLQRVITVHQAPAPANILGPASALEGAQLTYQLATGPGSWSAPGATGTGSTFTWTPTEPGDYRVHVTRSDGATDSMHVRVEANCFSKGVPGPGVPIVATLVLATAFMGRRISTHRAEKDDDA